MQVEGNEGAKNNRCPLFALPLTSLQAPNAVVHCVAYFFELVYADTFTAVTWPSRYNTVGGASKFEIRSIQFEKFVESADSRLAEWNRCI